MTDKKNIGIYHKFNVSRVDGTDMPGNKHFGCNYFVLDVTHDPFAKEALLTYIVEARQAGYRKLADELEERYT